MYNTSYSGQILTKPEFSSQILKKKSSNMNFMKISPMEVGWMDRQTDMMMLIAAFKIL